MAVELSTNHKWTSLHYTHTFPATSKSTNMYFSFICKKPSKHFLMMFITNKENLGCQHTITDSIKCLDYHHTSSPTSKYYHSDMSRESYNVHYSGETPPHIENTTHLQHYLIKPSPTPKVSNSTSRGQHFSGLGKSSYGKYFIIRFSCIATP